jgi:hypothetical protein
MSRATMYLLACGAIWFTEGYIFSVFLAFRVWQTLLLTTVYAALWLTAAAWLFALVRREGANGNALPAWRYLSLAPMLTVTLGSFISLPIVVTIAALGKLV